MLSWRWNRVVWKIYVLEVRFHVESEIAHLRNLSTAKTVAPLIQTLGAIADLQCGGLSRANLGGTARWIFFVGDCGGDVVYGEYQIIIDCLRSGKSKREGDQLFFIARIVKAIDSTVVHLVSAVPEQTLLPVLEVKHNVDATAVER